MMKKSAKKFKIIKCLFLICIIYFTATSFYNVISQINENNDKIASLNKQIAEEKKVTGELEEKNKKSKSDEYYKEVARDTLGLVNPGDKVYINSNDIISE